MISKIKEVLFGNRVLQHILFWVVSYFILLGIFSSGGNTGKIDYLYDAIFHVTVIPFVYLNLLVLIPRLLDRMHYLAYLLSVLGLTVLGSELNILLFEKWIDYILPGYYFISYYSFADIIKFMVVFHVVTTLIKFSRGWFRLSEANMKLSRLQKEKAETELSVLRGQVNPHFLFNSLNSIYSLALNNSGKTPGVILKLSDIMRYVIYESNTGFVELNKEIKYLNDYIELQKLRSDHRASITFTVKGDTEEITIAPLLFFPLVENSFKHGIKGTTGSSYVNIAMTICSEALTFVIENNKGVVDEVEIKEAKGIGLENVRRRLELIYPGRHSFNIIDTEESFRVELTINN